MQNHSIDKVPTALAIIISIYYDGKAKTMNSCPTSITARTAVFFFFFFWYSVGG